MFFPSPTLTSSSTQLHVLSFFIFRTKKANNNKKPNKLEKKHTYIDTHKTKHVKRQFNKL